jgi:hypothetical protein
MAGWLIADAPGGPRARDDAECATLGATPCRPLVEQAVTANAIAAVVRLTKTVAIRRPSV